jgi:hypothetical protein
LSGGRAITLFQGTYNASNDYEVPAGTTAVVFFNGGGAGAVAANVFNNAFFDSLRLGSVSVTAILDEDNMASDSATALATQQSIKAYVDAQVGANNELSEILANGNTSGGNDIQMTTTDEVQFRDTALKISSSVDGQLDIAADVELEIVAPTLDINASTAVTIDTTTMTMTGSVNVVGDLDVDNLNINGNSIISTNTDGNIALTPNGTGEVDISKVDIDGGTIDGTVIGGSTPAAGSFTTLNTSGAVVFNEAGADVDFRVETDTETHALFVDGSSNNVGIQVANPAASLEVSTSSVDYRIQLTHTSGQNQIKSLDGDQSTYRSLFYDALIHVFQTSGSERLRIDSSGNVGIGTSSPAYKLDVVGGSIGISAGQSLICSAATQSYLTLSSSASEISYQGTLNFRAFNVGSPVSAMFLSSSGNVGIGTTSNFGAQLTNYKADGVGTYLGYTNNSGTFPKVSAIGLGSDAVAFTHTSGGSSFALSGSAQIAAIQSAASGAPTDLAFYTNALGTVTERMRIDSDGNVGIGTSSPSEKLQVEGNILADASFYGSVNRSVSNPADTVELRISANNSAGIITAYTNGSEHLRIDSSGNVGVGTSSPDAKLRVNSGTALQARFSNIDGRGLAISTFTSAGTTNNGVIYNAGSTSDGQHVWECGGTERARIDASGNLLVGTTTLLSFGKTNVLFDGQTQIGLSMETTFGSVGSDFIRFLDSSGTKIGEIEQNGASTVSYTTSSDYRLKEDVQPMVGSVDRLMALKPVNFAWKVDGSRVDGFLAHEAQEVVPEAVTGQKDAVDKDGKPEYQGIDQSKIVPLLTAALQEALTEIADLKARVAALEA